MGYLQDLQAKENVASTERQRKSRNLREASREMKDKMNAALRNATSTKERREIKQKFKVDANKASNQTDNQQGANEDSNQRGSDDFKPTYNNVENDGSGSGLPEFPGDAPGSWNGVLTWSTAEDDALWMQGDDTAEDSEGEPLPQVMLYDPTPGTQSFSLLGAQLLDVIICQDGEPVEGRILFAESLS